MAESASGCLNFFSHHRDGLGSVTPPHPSNFFQLPRSTFTRDNYCKVPYDNHLFFDLKCLFFGICNTPNKQRENYCRLLIQK